MEVQFPFEFGYVYIFKNQEIGKNKFHIYIGSSEFTHHFFLINSEARDIYKPHHPIFINKDTDQQYAFLKKESFIGCKDIFEVKEINNHQKTERLSYDDMKAMIKLHEKCSIAQRDMVEYINYYLESEWRFS